MTRCECCERELLVDERVIYTADEVPLCEDCAAEAFRGEPLTEADREAAGLPSAEIGGEE